MAYTDEDLEELLKQRMLNKSGTPLLEGPQVDTSFLDQTMGVNPMNYQQPEYPLEMLSGLSRGLESVTDAPRRASIAAGVQGGNPFSAFASQFGENPDNAPDQEQINEIAKLRYRQQYPDSLMSDDVAGIPELDVGPMAALGEIKGVIQGGLPARLAAEKKLLEYAKKGELSPSIMKNLDNAIYETVELNQKRDRSGIDSPFYDKANQSSRKRRDQLNDIWSAQKQAERDKDRIKRIKSIEQSYEPGFKLNTKNNSDALVWLESKVSQGVPIDIEIDDLYKSRELLEKLPKGSVIRYVPGNAGSRFESGVLEDLYNKGIQIEVIDNSLGRPLNDRDRQQIKDVSNYMQLIKNNVKPVDFPLERFIRKNKT